MLTGSRGTARLTCWQWRENGPIGLAHGLGVQIQESGIVLDVADHEDSIRQPQVILVLDGLDPFRRQAQLAGNLGEI